MGFLDIIYSCIYMNLMLKIMALEFYKWKSVEFVKFNIWLRGTEHAVNALNRCRCVCPPKKLTKNYILNATRTYS